MGMNANDTNQRVKCTYADKYKVIYAPRCGCLTCEKKWEEKQKMLEKR